MKKVSIIMPALNEELNISEAVSDCLRAFDEFGIDGELVVVNDGSSDRTPELINEVIAENKGRLRVINHDKPKGVGASFWDGVDAAAGEAVIKIPADNENDPREMLRYIKLLDDVDMVVPFVYNTKDRPKLRNILSSLYRMIINLTFRTRFNYTNGTVLYRKSVLYDVSSRCNGFFYETDIVVRLAKKGYLFAEVPYSIRSRSAGRSKALSFSSFLRLIKDYFKLVKDVYFCVKGEG